MAIRLLFTNMKANKHLVYILVTITQFCFSQVALEQIPLVTFLETTETKFNVKFSYAFNDVSHVNITPPKDRLNLEQTLIYLNKNSLLNFKKLDERYITVSVLNKVITICGVIKNSANEQPLAGTSIVIENTSKGTISNFSGAFQLDNVPLNSTVFISYLGYKSIRINTNTLFKSELDNCNIIRLIEDDVELNEVNITKYLTTGLQTRLDGSTVLNTKKFGILPGLIEPDILQSIQALPGVESTDESISNINVRGGSNDENLMLWDNIKMYHSGHFFGLISAYNPNLTNKVIVSKNGTSSQYSDGVSSTINMYTKNNISNTFSGGAGINLISADLFLEIPITKNLEFHVSGRRSFTDILSTPTYENYFNRSFQDSDINTSLENGTTASNFNFYDYTSKVLYNINDNHKIRANIIGINNTLDYSETINSDNETSTKSSNLKQENLGIGATWMAHWSPKLKTEFITYYSKYNVEASDLRKETNQLLLQGNEVLETGAKLNINYKWSKQFNLLLGYQFNETGILNRTSVSIPFFNRVNKEVLINHALYTEGEYNNGSTYLRGGVRVNYFQKFKLLLVEPRINISQRLSHQFSLKLEGQFKNQTATQIIDFQDDFLGVENRRWILANENDIPITTSKQGSMGILFKQNNFNLEFKGFYKLVEGITTRNQGFYNNFQFLNASGNYTVKGLEFLANKTAENYSAWLSYTYAKNDYEFKQFTPSMFPNNVDIRHSVSLAFNYSILKNLKIALGGIWRSGQPFTKPLDGNETIQDGNNTFVNYDLPNNENLPSFMRFDTSLSYSFQFSKTTKGTINAGIKNVTNQKNIINRYYEVNREDSEKTIQIDNLSLKLTPNVSFRIAF